MFNRMDPNLEQNTYNQFDNTPIVVGSVLTDPNAKLNPLALIGFIMTFFFGIVGVIMCIAALAQIKKTGQKGKGLAIAGIIIGLLPLLFVIGIIIFLFTEFGGEIEATSIGKQSCEKVDNLGYYETSDLEYGEEGYVRCTANKCQIFYKGNTYDYVCEVEEEYYE